MASSSTFGKIFGTKSLPLISKPKGKAKKKGKRKK